MWICCSNHDTRAWCLARMSRMDPAAVAARMALPIFFFPIRAAGFVHQTTRYTQVCFVSLPFTIDFSLFSSFFSCLLLLLDLLFIFPFTLVSFCPVSPFVGTLFLRYFSPSSFQSEFTLNKLHCKSHRSPACNSMSRESSWGLPEEMNCSQLASL